MCVCVGFSTKVCVAGTAVGPMLPRRMAGGPMGSEV